MEPMRVLLVEDENTTQKLVEEMLENLGCEVETACTAEEGLDRFGRDVFDVVLSDVNLPGMDGIEMIRKIRNVDNTVMPVVMTVRQDQETAVRALECGAVCFLIKPFSREDLQVQIERALCERKHAMHTRLMVGDLIHTRGDLLQKLNDRDRRLSMTEAYLQRLLDAVPFGILSTDVDGQLMTLNQSAEHMYGYSSADVVGKPISVFFGKEQPAPASVDVQSGFKCESMHMRKNGQEFPVFLVWNAVLDEAGKTIAFLYVVEDRSEREKMEAQLLYAERLSMMGQMAPMIAHEFKTPLQIISGYVELAQHQFLADKPEQACKSLETVAPMVQKILKLVHQISDLGKPVQPRYESLDLRVELERLLETLRNLGAVKYCTVVKAFAENVPHILGDPSQIEQAFRNLIVNAAQAMAGSTKPVLILGISPSTDKKRVVVSIKDNGMGISREHLNRIFDPFFTTKPEGQGTGLGLAIVKMVMNHHRGDIRVESMAGRGARFILSFPAQIEHSVVCEA